MMKFLKMIMVLIIVLVLGWTAFLIWQKIENFNSDNSNLPTNTNKDSNQVGDVSDLIQVLEPQVGELIQSPLLIEGKARGTWFFEASFPVKLLDDQGNGLAQGIAQAQSDWMTENFVPFTATLTFTKPATATGTLILQKDNPSGLPADDAQISVPILFSENNQTASKPCIITGCSKQVCAEEEVITTCDFNPGYICYTKAECERQVDGQCGWTKTPDLATCLAEFTDE
ncbi:MAG: Gmad2 immunoglobulin-like domain-containing protein [Patescibacteria group bacterium]